jgi:hypothetical protein
MTASRCIGILAVLLVLAAPGLSQQRGRTRAVMVPKGPRLDASLADPLWSRAPALSLHAVLGKEGKLATAVRLLFGPTDLFVAVRCGEPDRDLQAKARQRDGKVWDDDCIELYVLPHPKLGYKQIAINPLGTVFDQSFAPGKAPDRQWNADVKLAVSTQPGKGWTIVLSVPYKDLGAFAADDQTWRFNVTRIRKGRRGAPQQEYTWAMLPSAEFHRPDAFGIVEGIDLAPREGGVTRRADALRSGLAWTRLRVPRGVRRVFCHPLDPNVAWCAATGGLFATSDDGARWAAVDSASADAVGEATCLAVSTYDPQTLCLGTEGRGLLLSSDGGRSWQRAADGYASKHIERLAFCPSDPSRRTLIVTHGLRAPGMSLSRDLGQTWQVLGTDRFLTRFVKQGETIVAVGSMAVTEGKVWGIHRSGTDGFRWQETVRGIRPSAPAVTDARWQFFVATLDGTILHSFNDGRSWHELARADGAAWASLFFTNGPTNRNALLAAYDPHRQGLCLSRHRFSDGLGERQNRGLYVGPFVKSGAECTPNANGTTYYIAMNNTLWVGRWALPGPGPAVAQARCVPCAVRVDEAAMANAQRALYERIAALAAGGPVAEHIGPIATAARTFDQRQGAMRFTILAQVRRHSGAAAVRAVTADLSMLGGPKDAPLRDDGRHEDERAGDGLYGARVRFGRGLFQQRDFRERLLVTVQATDTHGLSDTWPAVVNVSQGPVPASLMHGGWDSSRTEGPVSVRMHNADGARGKASVLQYVATGPGPWRATWLVPSDGVNSAGLKRLSFYIKGDVDQDLSVCLVDHHKIGSEGFLDEPHYSLPIPLIAGGYLRAITLDYQAVSIPLAKMLPKRTYFLRWHTAGIALLAAEGARPATYHVDLVRVEP